MSWLRIQHWFWWQLDEVVSFRLFYDHYYPSRWSGRYWRLYIWLASKCYWLEDDMMRRAAR